jgi:hypothetical protein
VNGDLKIRGYTVAQFPNPPLIVALVGLIASRLLDQGSTAWALSRGLFFIGLTIWAWLELTDGVNGFRRVLGAAGLAFVCITMAGDLR